MNKKITSAHQNPKQITGILENNGFKIDRTSPPVGDYIWNNTCVEGKEINDFINSLFPLKGSPGTGRLWRQLEEMEQFDTKVLLVYHTENELNKYNRKPYKLKSLYTALGRITKDYNISVITMPTYRMAAYYIMGLYRATYKEASPKFDVVKLKKPYVSLFYNIPKARISPKIGSEIENYIKDERITVLDWFKYDVDGFMKIKSIGKKRAENIYNVLNGGIE